MLQIDKDVRQQWQNLLDKRAKDLDASLCLFIPSENDAPWFASNNSNFKQIEATIQALSSRTDHVSLLFGADYSTKIYPIVDNNDVIIVYFTVTVSPEYEQTLNNLDLDTLVIYIQHHLQKKQKKSDPLAALSLQEFLNSMDDHFWIKDLKGTYRYTNPRVKVNLGMSPEQMIGHTDKELFDPETAEMFAQADFQTIRERRQITFPRYARVISDSQKIWADSMKAPIFSKNGEIIGIIGASRDVTNNQNKTKQLYKLAYFDTLTELSNRTHLMLELNKKIKFAKEKQKGLAFLSVDIDFFQRINESYSHNIADALLIKIAQRLKKGLPPQALLARIDGDEFAVAFMSEKAKKEAKIWSGKIQRLFQTPFQLSGKKEIRLSVSIGIAVYPEQAPDAGDLLRHANAALAKAKQLGRNRVEFYSNALNLAAERQVQIQEYLYKALTEHYFHLVYQAKVSLSDLSIFGYEALLRMEIPGAGQISPAEFIPVAESSGLIIDIGTWVLEQACSQAKKWLNEGFPFRHVAVNVSAAQLNKGDFISRLKFILEMTQLPPEYLQLEITESMLMDNPEAVIITLNEITDLGIRLAMDDFGTGYSSLSYLKDLPLSQLKIDRSFVVALTENSTDAETETTNEEIRNNRQASCKAIVQATIAMAKAFNLSIVAEGIELEYQAQMLREMGCEYGQGFLYHKPERFS